MHEPAPRAAFESDSSILIHAGMGKTGSTAIQRWLRENQRLLKERGIHLVHARIVPGEHGIAIKRYRHGDINSTRVIRHLMDKERKSTAAKAFVDELDRLAAKFGRILISGESLSEPFWRHDVEVLARLNGLASRHRVVVACYVRPQHSALEAGWRQWGFRAGVAPAGYLRARSRQLDYDQTLTQTAIHAPALDLRIRPFRRDLLRGADVVVDFVETFLGMSPGAVDGGSSNVGLPLTVINLLAAVHEAGLWRSEHDNWRLDALRTVFDEDAFHDPRAEAGRRVLQKWAYGEFGASNTRLVERLGWPVDAWVPDIDAVDNLDEVDDLWRPTASPSELEVFARLIRKVTAALAPHA